MIKAIAMLRKKPAITREAFIDYYETRHSGLIRRLLPGIVEYRRNFVNLEGAFVSPDAGPIDFDVITEVWFADRAAYDAALAKAAEPETARLIIEDEENLFDRAATRMFLVEEYGGVTV
jgi:hypothetical protein